MPVSFNYIPANLRLGLVWAELDPSQGGTFVQDRRSAIVGHPASGNTNDANTWVYCPSADWAAARYGAGSQIAAMVRAFRRANAFDELWVCPVAEPSGGTAASGSIEVTSAPTAAGTLALYIAGQRLQIAIAASDDAAGVATKIKNAIDAATSLPVSATVLTDTVTITAAFKGVAGNSIDIRHSYRGMQGGESLPAGLAMTITAMSSGAGAPDIDTAMTNLGDLPFEHVVLGWNDDATLDDFDAEFSFQNDAGRWGWLRQLYGHVHTAVDGSASALTTWGNARNGPTMGTWGLYGSPTPFWERAAVWGAVHHRSLLNDPARPLRTLELTGVLAPEEKDRLTASQKNTLLFDGISVSMETPDGRCLVHQSITNYQKNAYATADDSLLKVQTLATNAYLLRSMKQRIESRFPRHKLANDGTRFGPGQAVCTPSMARAELVAQYREHEFLALVENAAAFKANLIVERDVTNPNRLNVLYPPDLVNQLDVFAVVNQFRLQYSQQASADASVPLI